MMFFGGIRNIWPETYTKVKVVKNKEVQVSQL